MNEFGIVPDSFLLVLRIFKHSYAAVNTVNPCFSIFYDSNQVFGTPKITAILKGQGEFVSRGFVSEPMKGMGLVSIGSGAKKQFEDESCKCKNLVKREFKTDQPNQIWVSDVTYYRFSVRLEKAANCDAKTKTTIVFQPLGVRITMVVSGEN